MRVDTPGSRDITKTTLAVLFIGVFIAASFWILRPFLTSIVWATMIVVATWPLLLWLQARLKNSRGLAVAVMTVLILMVVIVPFLLAVATIIERRMTLPHGLRRWQLSGCGLYRSGSEQSPWSAKELPASGSTSPPSARRNSPRN